MEGLEEEKLENSKSGMKEEAEETAAGVYSIGGEFRVLLFLLETLISFFIRKHNFVVLEVDLDMD